MRRTDPRACKSILPESPLERSLFDDVSPSSVDKDGARLHQCKLGVRNEVSRAGRERAVEREHVEDGEEGVKRGVSSMRDVRPPIRRRSGRVDVKGCLEGVL